MNEGSAQSAAYANMACFPDFHRGQIFVINLSISQNRFIYQLDVNADK